MPTEPQPAVVNEKTAFTFPVIVVLGTLLLSAGGGFVRLNGVDRDVDLLRARVDLLEHQQSADRGQLQSQGATLTEMKAILVDLRTDVREALRTKPAKHQE